MRLLPPIVPPLLLVLAGAGLTFALPAAVPAAAAAEEAQEADARDDADDADDDRSESRKRVEDETARWVEQIQEEERERREAASNR